MHKIGIIALVLVAALGALPTNVQASQFTVVAQVSPATVSNGGTATLTVHTRIGADCVVSILYDDGGAAPGLPGQHVGQSGIVQWKWATHTSASGGTGASACTSKGATAIGQARFSVGVAAGSPQQPGPIPGSPKGKVILLWSGKHATKSDDFDSQDSSQFIQRGPFIFFVRASAIDPSKPATGFPYISNPITFDTSEGPTIALGAGDKPFTYQANVTNMSNCKVGCLIRMRAASNLAWDAEIIVQ